MAWALEFDGVNDYVSIPTLSSSNVSSNISWDIEIDNFNDIGSDAFFGVGYSTDELIAVRSSGDVDYRRGGVNTRFSSAIGDPSTRYKIKLTMRWSGGNRVLSLYVNDVLLGVENVSSAGVAPIEAFGRAFSIYRPANLIRFTYTDNNNASNSHDWDATASSHTTGQPVLTDTISGNNATGVNMPTDGSAWKAIFPDAYTLLVEYDLPTITGTHTDFVMMLKYDDFNVGDALNFIDNGGGDLRISDDINGTTQLPIEVVEFDKVGLSAQVWVKIPSAFTGKTIYLWGDNTGDSQPAITDTYGRNAVWSSSYYSGLKNGTTTDSSGNTSVTVGSGSISSRTGVNGLAVDFDGSTELSLNTLPSGIGDYYLSAWVLRDSGTETAFYGTAKQAPDEMDIGIRYDSSGFATSTTNVFKVSSNSTAQETTPSGTCPQSQWIHTVLTRQGATSKFYIDGIERASWNSGSSAMSPSSFFIGTGVKSPTKLNGGMQSLDWGSGFKSEDFAATEYDNQSTVGAWGVPTRYVGGGAAPNYLIVDLTSVFNSAGKLTVDLTGKHTSRQNLLTDLTSLNSIRQIVIRDVTGIMNLNSNLVKDITSLNDLLANTYKDLDVVYGTEITSSGTLIVDLVSKQSLNANVSKDISIVSKYNENLLKDLTAKSESRENLSRYIGITYGSNQYTYVDNTVLVELLNNLTADLTVTSATYENIYKDLGVVTVIHQNTYKDTAVLTDYYQNVYTDLTASYGIDLDNIKALPNNNYSIKLRDTVKSAGKQQTNFYIPKGNR